MATQSFIISLHLRDIGTRTQANNLSVPTAWDIRNKIAAVVENRQEQSLKMLVKIVYNYLY